MSENVKPWDLPDKVIERVTANEMLAMLRGRINNSYMPSATGEVKYNSKPEYIRGGPDQWFEDKLSPFYAASGCYASDIHSPPYPKDTGIYAVLLITDIIVACQLQTGKLWVSLNEPSLVWHAWTEQSIPIERNVLASVIDCYL